ncbi:MAG: oxidoreductase domain protein [Acidobacteria bacterium]|nr:oxidoreductase domain protein [Acidobacteriota bacterium]
MARIGIIGTGWGARVQTPAFREAGLEVVAIAGRSPARTKEIAADLGLQPFDDWRSLVAANDLDLITIVTPPSEHVTMAVTALEAGKHVLCEKPTAVNVVQAQTLVHAAHNHPDRITLIDHELRFLPSFQAARAQLRELGALYYAEVRYSSPARGDRKREWNWWSDAASGGGIWGAVGSHYADALRYLIAEVDSVQATLHTFIAERPFDGRTRAVTSDDFAAVNARLANGALAAMTFSAVSGGPDEPSTMTIHGEHGALRLAGEELLRASRGEPFARVAGHDTAKRPGNSSGGAFGTGTLLLGRALRAALDDGDRSTLAPAATFEDGLAQQRILDAARRSSGGVGGWEKVTTTP